MSFFITCHFNMYHNNLQFGLREDQNIKFNVKNDTLTCFQKNVILKASHSRTLRSCRYLIVKQLMFVGCFYSTGMSRILYWRKSQEHQNKRWAIILIFNSLTNLWWASRWSIKFVRNSKNVCRPFQCSESFHLFITSK